MNLQPMLHTLSFVLSREGALPKGDCEWHALVEAQRQGLRSGTQLRLFRVSPSISMDLAGLADTGALKASGDQPFPKESPAQLLCDALVPLIEPRSLWLGVYHVTGRLPECPEGESGGKQPGLQLHVDSVQCLDCYPLQDAANETCWFYPTENGRYLAWENRRTIQTLPGYLPDRPPQTSPMAYSHGDVHVLWSLMADDVALTCVGLSWRRQRIEWPLQAELPENLSNWTEFEVDSMAESSYRELNSTTVFQLDD
ncbi:MAG: hypothetical protein ACK5W5_07320 [Cyanobacteriota bacterium]